MNVKNWVFGLALMIVSGVCAKESWNSYKNQTLEYQKNIPGWCIPEKVFKLMDLIKETNPKIVVEVGVYGGSSVYPMARALKYMNNKGLIYAIDPWKEADCLVGYERDDANYDWWKNHSNLNDIFNSFAKMLRSEKLLKQCRVMRTTSEAAASTFNDESIDIVHIDGNHTEERALGDVQLYMPKLKSGGYLWLDDADWHSTHKAVEYLMDNCIYLEDKSVIAQTKCLLFRKK